MHQGPICKLPASGPRMASKMIARTAAAERAALSSCLQQSRLAGRCSENVVVHLQISQCLSVANDINFAHWEPCDAQPVLLTLADLEPSDLVQGAVVDQPWLIRLRLMLLDSSANTQTVYRVIRRFSPLQVHLQRPGCTSTECCRRRCGARRPGSSGKHARAAHSQSQRSRARGRPGTPKIVRRSGCC